MKGYCYECKYIRVGQTSECVCDHPLREIENEETWAYCPACPKFIPKERKK